MSLKNIKEYYDEVFFCRKRAVDLFNKFSAVAQNTLVTPEELEDKKKILEPIDKTYQTISYIMFLIGKDIKSVKKYYDKLYRVNEDIQKDLIEFEEYAKSSGKVDDATLEIRREFAKSVQDNLEEIAWLLYLLNMPNKKTKRKRYIQLNEKKMSKINISNRYDHKLEECEKYINELNKK